jgi:hypothetical protein
MSTRVCTVCGEVLSNKDGERSTCLLCLHRTIPQERVTPTRRLPGLIDSA